nr:MAG TPA: hypothetical protein [Myoviridae sp. ctict13]
MNDCGTTKLWITRLLTQKKTRFSHLQQPFILIISARFEREGRVNFSSCL